MPSAPLVMRTAAGSAVSTPAADHAGLVFDSEAAIPGEPAWIDDAGTLRSLKGEPGELTYQDHGNTGATETVDASAADIHRLVANAATVTLTLSGAPSAGTPGVIRLWLEQDGTGGRDWAFPGSVDWGGPGEPVWTDRTAGQIDIVDLSTVDGGTVWVASFQPDAGSLDAILTASSGEDIADALTGAAAPDASNVFATMADVGGGGTIRKVQVHHSGTQTIGTGGAVINCDVEDLDASGIHSAGTFTLPAGNWRFICYFSWAATTTGDYRQMQIKQGSTVVGEDMRAPGSSNGHARGTVTAEVFGVSAGTTCTVEAFHNVGSNLNITCRTTVSEIL